MFVIEDSLLLLWGCRLALCDSRQLTYEVMNYATIECEASAVVWCLKKVPLFLLGYKLVKLFGDRELTRIENHRLFHLKEKYFSIDFK